MAAVRRFNAVSLTLASLMLLGAPAEAAAPPVSASAHSAITSAYAALTVDPSPAPVDPVAQQISDAAARQAALDITKQSLQAEIQAAQATQLQLHDLIVANQKAIEDTMAKIAIAEQTFSTATQQAESEAAIAAAARLHAKADKQVLGVYIREQYATHDDIMAYVLSGGSISDILERAATATHATESAHALLLRVEDDVTTADKAEAAAQADANAAQAAAADLASQRDSLTQQTSNARTLIGQLSGESAAANAELTAADGQDAQLAQQIADLRIQQLDDTIAKAEAADWTSAEFYIQHNLTNFPGLDGTPITLNVGNGPLPLIWAAPGTSISQGFGPSPYPFEPAYQGFPHFHTGIDLAGPLNTPVYAAADGVVVAASQSTVGYGNHVILAHADGLLTLYGHLNTIIVHPGDQVHQGQLIGLLGSTGNSTGPHLHFEVRVNGQPTNPLAFLPPLPPGASGPPRN